MKNKVLWAVAILFSFPAFAQSDDVTVSVRPNTPVVIDSDLKLSNDEIIRGPWFAVQASVDNQSQLDVEIIDVKFTVRQTLPDGSTAIVELTRSPSDANFTLHCQNDVTVPIEYSDFGWFHSGHFGPLELTYHGQLPDGCDSNETYQPDVTLYVGGLPSSDYSHKYNVQMTLVGWTGTLSDPLHRFTKTVEFQTQ
jgi:hypothetical protein